MSRRILIIIGHPDPAPERFCRALAAAYAAAAERAGHQVRKIDLAIMDFPLLRTADAFEHGPVPAPLREAAEAVVWSEHLVFVFPLWLGTMPALLKGFLEQVMRPGVAFDYPDKEGALTKSLLRGRSARIVVTMGMPTIFYRLWFLSHGIASMRRGILNFVGIKPVRETLLGPVGGINSVRRSKWIRQMEKLGEQGL
ncbi:NAD(P)H-dependent oxidoreductase [Aminobacter sp. LjRoot7]|uniref:NAD(P)H-dependent oxidoreductase n=1 Tax=Aminobacter sp. LjRoot7 TaxID=3342335 RepID=UPI003ED060BC